MRGGKREKLRVERKGQSSIGRARSRRYEGTRWRCERYARFIIPLLRALSCCCCRYCCTWRTITKGHENKEVRYKKRRVVKTLTSAGCNWPARATPATVFVENPGPPTRDRIERDRMGDRWGERGRWVKGRVKGGVLRLRNKLPPCWIQR